MQQLAEFPILEFTPIYMIQPWLYWYSYVIWGESYAILNVISDVHAFSLLESV